MSGFSQHTRRTVVRAAFSEESIWRSALGPQERLFVFVTCGALDALEDIPAGGHRSIAGNVQIGMTCHRDGVPA